MAEQLFKAPIQPKDSDERYTPQWVFTHLGIRFGCDPCSPVEGGDYVPADVKYTIVDDGLAQPWVGTVWVNPPFSNASAFADRFIVHSLGGIFLGPVANSRWTQDVLEAADVVWLCQDFAFTHPTHAGKRSSMPLIFYAIGETATAGLTRLASSGVHRGCLMSRVVDHVGVDSLTKHD